MVRRQPTKRGLRMIHFQIFRERDGCVVRGHGKSPRCSLLLAWSLRREASNNRFTGFRHPWGLSFDSATGKLWLAHVGQDHGGFVDLGAQVASYCWRLSLQTLGVWDRLGSGNGCGESARHVTACAASKGCRADSVQPDTRGRRRRRGGNHPLQGEKSLSTGITPLMCTFPFLRNVCRHTGVAAHACVKWHY